jgi:hypothetical protein
MDIWNSDKLFIFIAFVIPGFVSIKTYALLFPGISKSSSEQLIDAVAYSCINYALMLWPIYEVESRNIRILHPNIYVAFYVVVLLLVPVALALGLRIFRKLSAVQRLVPHPTARPWDYVFSKRRSYWVLVTLKDGKRIGGKYCRNSFSSSSPAPEQIYLEETWVINDEGGFERKRMDSAGILILSVEIVTIEFFFITEGDINEQSETSE